MDTCIICNTSLSNVEVYLRARMRAKDGRPAGDRVIYKAWCTACEIYLKKSEEKNKVSNWFISDITASEIEYELSDKEFSDLKNKMRKKMKETDFSLAKEQWDEFIAVKKESDSVCFFKRIEASYRITGYVVCRSSYVISYIFSEIEDLKK